MIALGDIHGNFRVINQYEFPKGTNIIQVGDFGLGFDKKDEQTMDYWNKSWEARGYHIYAIRGNHDDPKWWDGRHDGRWSNIHLVQDYAVLHLEGKNILCVGGAVSVDRIRRFEGRDYWKDEVFIMDVDKLASALEGTKIDIVVTHTAPQFCYPPTKGPLVSHFSERDVNLMSDLKYERALVDTMFHYMVQRDNKPGKWVYGHFHDDNVEYIEDVKFVLLGIGEITNL